jgi:hypothetical protein
MELQPTVFVMAYLRDGAGAMGSRGALTSASGFRMAVCGQHFMSLLK